LDVFDPSDFESWDEIGDYFRRGRSEYFVEIRMLCLMGPSHTNTNTVRGRPAPKTEIRRFRNGPVRELKVIHRVKYREYFMESAGGIYARVVDVSEIERVNAANE